MLIVLLVAFLLVRFRCCIVHILVWYWMLLVVAVLLFDLCALFCLCLFCVDCVRLWLCLGGAVVCGLVFV